MGSGNVPPLQTLEQPEKFQDVLRRDRSDDCLSCKIVGSGTFLGLAGYSYFSGMSQLEQQKARILQSNSRFGMRSRKFGIATISMGLAWMGIWRAVK